MKKSLRIGIAGEREKALVIVAHPDDETIWMGGTILENKDWDWTIISLCRMNDLDRAPKFRNVCKFYNAKSIISNLNDEILKPLKIEEVANKIKSLLPEKEYDLVFTHGGNGEYGHLRHIETHKAVEKLIALGELKGEKIYYFDYEKSEQSTPGIPDLKIPKPKQNSDFTTTLDEYHYLNKLKLIKEFYGFNDDSFETLSCNKKEAFKLK